MQPAPGDWSLHARHIWEVASEENQAVHEYVTNWLAWSFQHPGERAGVAFVMRGGQGIGKGILAQSWLRIFGANGHHIVDPGDLVGKFNGRQAYSLAVYADEALYAGDKKIEGVLKARITESTKRVEWKFADSVTMRNRDKIMMATNHDWAVPMDADDRRYFVTDVSPRYKGRKDYFDPLVQACADHKVLGAWPNLTGSALRCASSPGSR